MFIQVQCLLLLWFLTITNSAVISNIKTSSQSTAKPKTAIAPNKKSGGADTKLSEEKIKMLFDEQIKKRSLLMGSNSNPSQLNYRLSIFKQNIDKINEHNSKPGVTFKLKSNKFSAMTPSEFKATQLMPNKSPMARSEIPVVIPMSALDPLTIINIDWRKQGKMSPVKKQGNCGACWAFSSIATIESYVAIQRGTVPESYSQQQVIDSAHVGGYGVSPCEGSYPELAYNYINSSGLALTRDYPYVEKKQVCKDQKVKTRKYLDHNSVYGKASGFSNILYYLVKGPMAVAVDATEWQFYSEGIMKCGDNLTLNHACTLAGFSLFDQSWLIKNSWGTDWGEQGYIRVDAINSCGLISRAYFPFVNATSSP